MYKLHLNHDVNHFNYTKITQKSKKKKNYTQIKKAAKELAKGFLSNNYSLLKIY